MGAYEWYKVLKGIGATHLHHANSITTSSMFLEQGALVSRGFVETEGLQQTPQNSDDIDKRYGIWDCVFFDHVDIHDRAGAKKGPNQYGPVLFQLPLAALLGLPEGSEIFVTKINPMSWYDSLPDNERCFVTAEELKGNIQFGDFGKMLVIRTPTRKVDFPKGSLRIILDDPQAKLSSGADAYTHAEVRLQKAAAVGGVEVRVERRICPEECICTGKYKKIDFWFT